MINKQWPVSGTFARIIAIWFAESLTSQCVWAVYVCVRARKPIHIFRTSHLGVEFLVSILLLLFGYEQHTICVLINVTIGMSPAGNMLVTMFPLKLMSETCSKVSMSCADITQKFEAMMWMSMPSMLWNLAWSHHRCYPKVSAVPALLNANATHENFWTSLGKHVPRRK